MKMLEKQYPVDAKDYKLYEEVGEGVSAIVHRALCIPFNEIVAIKVLDLERCSNDLDGIRREVHTMSLIDHPNVLRAHCSFTEGHNLWIVMPYMAGGSCLHIMKSAYPDGFEEPVIATLLRETLKGLVYLHTQGHIHRDVKAGNILLDTNGTVKLADFGVSACMFDMGDRQRSRNTFVGTPCWMAPEVMQQLHGYDFRADIWSFGITALELAHGHAPFSKYPPMKVLLMILQNAPPGLDYERDKRFSKSFKEMVAACLVKDPKKRPTSEKLLKHKFFKHAKSNEYLAHILDGLPPLGERYRMLKARETDLFLQNKALNGDKEHKSLQEYIRGISAWNFNLEDLKRQASLIHDDDNILHSENPNMNGQKDTHDTIAVPVYKSSPKSTNRSNAADSHEDGLDDVDNVVGSLASFPIKPLQALKGCFDTDENDVDARTTTWKNAGPSDAEVQSPENKTETAWSTGEKNLIRSSSLPQFVMGGPKAVRSGPLLPDDVRSSKKHTDNGDRECLEARYPSDRNYSGPIFHRQKRDMNNHARVEDSPDGAAVQRKGRFQVTSADVSPKGLANNSLSHSPGSAAGITPLNPAAASVLPSLHRLLQHINMQQEEIIKLIKSLEQNSDNLAETDAISNGASQISRISARQEQLLAKVNQLQQRVGSLVEELQRQKLKNAQLERELNALLKKDEHSTD